MHANILQGTLDLMILRTLATMGPQHAYGIANRLQQVSEDSLNLNQGTIYPALVRLDRVLSNSSTAVRIPLATLTQPSDWSRHELIGLASFGRN